MDISSTVWVRPSYSFTPETPTSAPSEPPVWSINDTTKAVIVGQDGDSVQIEGVGAGSTSLRVELDDDFTVVWQPSGPLSAEGTIVVPNAPGPEACWDPEAYAMWKATDQYLNAGCSDQGPTIRYSWRFESGGDWTSPSADTLYEFGGHYSSGPKEVTLRVRDTATEQYRDSTVYFNVKNETITVYGNAAIEDKATYSYETNDHEAHWFERYTPSLDWTETVDWYTDSIARIWPAGEYMVDLRAEDFRADTLRRGLIGITVCTETQSCGDRERGLAAARKRALFGAGPLLGWMNNGTARVVQFYQLMGMHTVASVFASSEWLDEKGGRVGNGPWPGDLSWERREAEGIVTYSFEIDPPTTGEYVFGFAVDPDLGTSAAEDVSGYDALSGMAYVTDGTKAMGFLLKVAGRSAHGSVVQYGTRRFAPTSANETFKALRLEGAYLLPGKSDVQFMFAAPLTIGKGTFTVAVVEAENVAALVTKARALK